MPQTSQPYCIENDHLKVEVSRETFSLDVMDKASGLTWRMSDESFDEVVIDRDGAVSKHTLASCGEVVAKRLGPSALMLTFGDFRLQVLIWLEDNRLGVQMTPLEENGHFQIKGLVYPRQFKLDATSDAALVLPFQQGVMIPGNWLQPVRLGEGWPFDDEQRFRTYGELFNMNVEWWSSCRPGYSPALESNLIMPWWGAVRSGGSFMAVLDEQCWADSHLVVRHEPPGPTEYRLLWLPSHGRLSFPRTVTFHFFKGGNSVFLARQYRCIAEDRGKCVTLRQKNERNGTISRVIGSANSTLSFLRHDGRRFVDEVSVRFADAAAMVKDFHQATGIAPLHVLALGWQQRGHDIQYPDIVPPCPQCGGPVEFGQMARDIRALGDVFGLGGDNYHDVAMNSPLYDESMLLRYADGSVNRRNFWSSGLTSNICAGEALKYLRRNFEVGRTAYPQTLGLLATAPFDTYFLGNYISGYECYDERHPHTRNSYWNEQRKLFQYISDCGLLTNCEHPRDWAVPLFYMSRTRQERSGVYGYNKSGPTVGVPIPLWSLVYHDCVITGGDNALLQIMNGSPPAISIQRFDPRQTQRVKHQMALHKAVGFEAMVEHRFLGDCLQESTFGNGVKVRIDEKTSRYRISGVEDVREEEFSAGTPGSVPGYT